MGALRHSNNETGALQPIQELVKRARCPSCGNHGGNGCSAICKPEMPGKLPREPHTQSLQCDETQWID